MPVPVADDHGPTARGVIRTKSRASAGMRRRYMARPRTDNRNRRGRRPVKSRRPNARHAELLHTRPPLWHTHTHAPGWRLLLPEYYFWSSSGLGLRYVLRARSLGLAVLGRILFRDIAFHLACPCSSLLHPTPTQQERRPRLDCSHARSNATRTSKVRRKRLRLQFSSRRRSGVCSLFPTSLALHALITARHR